MIFCSFSGGKTSAMMAYLLKKSDPDCKFVFMNTGQEHAATYDFIKKCDEHFNLNLTILEPVVHFGQRKGCTHKIVSYETMHRGLDLFSEVVKKYGIMGPSYLHCTRELKANPFRSYRSSLDCKRRETKIAIGIRADEIDRMDEKADEKGYFYPLVKLGITKDTVNKFWQTMPFSLEIPEHYGNCVGCWKKSNRKLLTIAKENPHYLSDLGELEMLDSSRKMFRGNRTSVDVLNDSKKDFNQFTDLDFHYGCQESCEIF